VARLRDGTDRPYDAGMFEPRGRDDETRRIVARLAAGRSVIVHGEMGIGKTALLRHVAGVLRRDETLVTTIRANAAARSIPFGALTGFIDPADRADPAQQIAAAVDRIRRTRGDRSQVVFVDDAQHLDVASIAVLLDLVDPPAITLMASVRTSDPSPPELAELWRRVEAERLDLDPLEPPIVSQIVGSLLGPNATHTEISSIVTRASGNPLFAAELAQAHLDGTATGLTPQLVDLVELRLAALTPGEQEQLTFVAVAQPLDVSHDIVDVESLRRLEADGLVKSYDDHGRVVVIPNHPLYGEVIRHRQTPLQRRALARRLASALTGRPMRRRGEALRVVTWLLEAGDRPTPDLAEAAAFEAIGWRDTDLAERLARMAVEDDRRASTLYALGEVRRLCGHPGDAVVIWQEAFDLAEDDDDIRRIGLALGQLHKLFFRDAAAAIDVLEAAYRRIESPSLRFGIESDLAMERTTQSRLESAAEIDRLLDDPECGDESAWTALSNILWAKSSALDLTGIDRYLDRAAEIERRLPADRDAEIDLIRTIAINVPMIRGRLDEAIKASSAWAADASRRGIAHGLGSFSSALIQLMRGRADLASVDVDDSLEQLRSYDAFNATPMVRCVASMVAATRGDAAAAERHLAAAEGPGTDAPWIRVWGPRAHGWLAALRGDAVQARWHAVEGSKYAFDGGDLGWALLCLHDALAWGGEDDAAELIVQRGARTGCELFEIIFDHALASAARDPAALEACARRFEAAGAAALAGAAWANRAHIARDDIEACRNATRALSLAAPVALRPGTAERALTPRQFDIARLAGRGMASKEVAATLFLSGRTVDNHLRDTYRRLGISKRAELADVVAPIGDDPEPAPTN
jgi:DNA-binding CsgD family transcriptional regulator/energy-coupling factor transporter ATP-binding protein EcfA2